MDYAAPGPLQTLPKRCWAFIGRLTLLGLAALIALAGCAGGARPGGYDCTPVWGGCFTDLVLTSQHTDSSGAPDLDGTTLTGVSSAIQVVPLSCDDACRASSGVSGKPGYIANIVMLWQRDNGAYIRLGYRTTDTGVEEYFVQYSVPGKVFASVSLGATGVAPDSASPYPYADFSIYKLFGITRGDCGSLGLCFLDGWFVDISPKGGKDITYELSSDALSFTPNYIDFIQLIWGKSGATAGYTTFERNQYGDHLVDTFPGSTVQGPNWHYFTHNGVAPAEHGTAAHPSFGNWTFRPSEDTTGGTYHLYCCTPL